MKKILLPLLLAPMLVGCAEDKDFGWKTVEKNEIIQVFYGNTSSKYVSSEYSILKYRLIAYSNITEVYVTKTTIDSEETDYYVGDNLTVYRYEI